MYSTGSFSQIGMNSTASSGSVRVEASKTRRDTSPQAPPERYCSISSASEPIVMPVQKK